MLLNRKNDYEMSEIIIGEKRKKRKKHYWKTASVRIQGRCKTNENKLFSFFPFFNLKIWKHFDPKFRTN